MTFSPRRRALLLGAASAGVVPPSWAEERGTRIALAAESQVGKTLLYDARYVRLPYPMGDVALVRGVCADVVIRALRAVGIDLQSQVHRDMQANFAAYPQLWKLRRADPNIDHRRVPNLERFFARRGWTLPADIEVKELRSGDIVAWRLDNGLPHIGVVSTQQGSRQQPLMVHNIGAGARIEDVVSAWRTTGRYRVA